VAILAISEANCAMREARLPQTHGLGASAAGEGDVKGAEEAENHAQGVEQE